MRNSYKIVVGKPRGTKPLERLGKILKWILKNKM
jgi:hypothetical protein